MLLLLWTLWYFILKGPVLFGELVQSQSEMMLKSEQTNRFLKVWVRGPDVTGLEWDNPCPYFKRAWGNRPREGWQRAPDDSRVQSTRCKETGNHAGQVLLCKAGNTCSVGHSHWCVCVPNSGNSTSFLLHPCIKYKLPVFCHLTFLCPSAQNSLCSTACLCLPLWWTSCGEKREFGCLSTSIL